MQNPSHLETAFLQNKEKFEKHSQIASEAISRKRGKKIVCIDGDEKFLQEIRIAFVALGESIMVSTNPLTFMRMVGANNIKAVVVGVGKTGETCLEIIEQLKDENFVRIAIAENNEFGSRVPDHTEFIANNGNINNLANSILNLANSV